MKSSRASVRGVMLLVVAIAMDCAWLRFILTGRGSLILGSRSGGAIDLGILATLNVLGFGLYRLARERRRPFLVGFVLGGLASVLGFLTLCWLSPRSFVYQSVEMTIQRIHDYCLSHLPVDRIPGFDRNRLYPPLLLAPLLAIYASVVAVPLLLPALAGGLLARRLRSRALAREKVRNSGPCGDRLP